MSTWTEQDENTLLRKIKQAQLQPEPTGPQQIPEPNWWRTPQVASQQAPLSQVSDDYTKEGRQRLVEKEKREQIDLLEQKRIEREERLDSTLKALLKYLPNLASLGATSVSALTGNVPQTLYYLQKLANQQTASLGDNKELTRLSNEVKRLQKELQKATSKKSQKGKGAPTAWQTHCKQVQKDNPDMKWGEVLKKASTTYKK